ncbi:hypothetical protein Droror1_Dr00015187 [Drosera rotundifolia]
MQIVLLGCSLLSLVFLCSNAFGTRHLRVEADYMEPNQEAAIHISVKNDVNYKVINVEKVAIVKDEALNTLVEKDWEDHDVQRYWRQLDQPIMMKRIHCKLRGGAVRLRGMDELAAASAGRSRSRSRQKQIIKGKRSFSFSRLGIRRRKLGGHRGCRAVTVLRQSLTMPRIRKGSSSAPQPGFDLDYAPPKVHPGTHN